MQKLINKYGCYLKIIKIELTVFERKKMILNLLTLKSRPDEREKLCIFFHNNKSNNNYYVFYNNEVFNCNFEIIN